MSVVNVVCSNIIEKDDKSFLSKAIAKGSYSLPAGRLEFGESIIEGAIREAKEETGLVVKPDRLIGIYQRPSSSESSNTTVFCFSSKIVSGDITPSKKHPEIIFLSLSQIAEFEKENRLRSRDICFLQ
jgi:8-oxo-dGTP diphosphatase